MNATFDNKYENLKDELSKRRKDSKPKKKRLVKIKSSSELKSSDRSYSSFMKRKSSVGIISTSKLCHLPKDLSVPQTIKHNDQYNNLSGSLKRLMYDNKKPTQKYG